MQSATAITFDYRPSRGLTAAIVLIAVLAGLSALLSGVPRMGAVAIGVLIALAAAFAIRSRQRMPWRRIAWRGDETWALQCRDGNEYGASLLGWSRIGMSLVLRLKPDRADAVALVLLPDNVDLDTRRRLLVRLGQNHSTRLPRSAQIA